MATPTIGLLNSTSINTCESTTGFTTFDTLDTDIKKEGSNGITGTFRNDLSAGWYDAGSAPVTAANKHLRIWVNTTSVPYLDTEANGGLELLMYDGTTQAYQTIFSSDDYFGGWFNAVIDCNLYTTLTLANVQRWGVRVNYTSTAKNIDNVWIDYIRYLDGYYLTGGSSSDAITLLDVATADRGTTTLYGYGIILETEGVYLAYGTVQLGNGTTTTYFEMDGEVLIFTDQPVADGLYAINGNGSGADILITGSTLKTAGTSANTRFDFDMSTDSPGTVEVTNNVFQRGGVFTFASGQTITGNTFTDCQQITPNGADMTGSSISFYEGTADTAALVWNVATDPDGYLDDMSFTKGTASTHAIEFGSTSPSSITLRNCTFSGYNASDSQTDSTFYISDSNTGNSYTINCVGCSGNVTYKSAGASVSIVSDPVTVKVTVTDASGTLINSARVFLRASDGTGPFPYQDSVTIVNNGVIATVSHTSHGLATNDKVEIRGASLAINNGVHQITKINDNSYSYPIEYSILDDFNRTDEGPPPSSNWSNITGLSGWEVFSNQIRPEGTTAVGGFWTDTTFGADCLAFVTVATKPSDGNSVALFVRAQEVGSTSTLDGYQLIVSSSSGTDTWYLYSTTNGSNSSIASSISQELNSGDKILLSAVGTTITAYLDTGSGWTQVITGTDSTYSSAGYLGIAGQNTTQTVRLDDFGGGTISSVTGTITSTFVALSGLTASGVVSTSRVYPTDQPVIGWARKSSSSPYYKTGPLSGSVDSADGYSNTAVLILDE